MALKKDKQKVLNETIDEQRLTEFFKLTPPNGVNADFHILERAYRGLQAVDFKRFIHIFSKNNHDINASNAQGKSLLSIINTHANGSPYAETLKQAGAK